MELEEELMPSSDMRFAFSIIEVEVFRLSEKRRETASIREPIIPFDCKDCTKRDFPTAECPNNFSLIRLNGVSNKHSCSMHWSRNVS